MINYRDQPPGPVVDEALAAEGERRRPADGLRAVSAQPELLAAALAWRSCSRADRDHDLGQSVAVRAGAFAEVAGVLLAAGDGADHVGDLDGLCRRPVAPGVLTVTALVHA